MGLASRGLRDMDSGAERIEDEAELSQVRRQARRVQIWATVLTLVLTGLLLLLPA